MILKNRNMFTWMLAAFLFMLLVVTTSVTNGQDVKYGVIATKPVVTLPQDQNKWYVSIVGDPTDSQYQQIVSWFRTDRDLRSLRLQTHYNEIRKGTATYKERYESNIKGLPTVRVQDSESRVIYEASGNNIPYSAAGLYAAIAKTVTKTQGISCPWRRPCPTPTPEPGPAPPDGDPEPPPLDDGGAPVITPPNTLEAALQSGVGVLLLLDFIVSFIVGFALSWYRQYNTLERG